MFSEPLPSFDGGLISLGSKPSKVLSESSSLNSGSKVRLEPLELALSPSVGLSE